MNYTNFDDIDFQKSNTYLNFIKDNPSNANLNIRTSSFNDAIPISNVRIIVSKEIDGNKIVFFDGFTDDSGMINKIVLPTPKEAQNDLEIPLGIVYDINAIYDSDSFNRNYKVLMYPGICVVQNINIVPTNKVLNEMDSDNIGN